MQTLPICLAVDLYIYSHLLMEEASLILTGHSPMSRAGYHQESFHCHFVYFFRPIVFGFTLGLWVAQPLVLGYSSSVWHGSLLMEQALCQIRHCLATPPSFVPPLFQHMFAGRVNCKSNVLWLGWCLHFSFCSLKSTFLHRGDKNMKVKSPCRHQPNFFMFNEL